MVSNGLRLGLSVSTVKHGKLKDANCYELPGCQRSSGGPYNQGPQLVAAPQFSDLKGTKAHIIFKMTLKH